MSKIKFSVEKLYSNETQHRIRQSQCNIVEFNRVPHFADAMRRNDGAAIDFLAMLKKPTNQAETDARDLQINEFCGLITRARNGDMEAKDELNELQRMTVDLFVRANAPIATLFFEQNILAADQQPMITYTFNQEVAVKYIGEDGSPRSIKLTKAQSHDYIRMRRLWSAVMEYAIEDINLGIDIAGLAKATVDAAWDLAAQIDALAYTLLKTRFAAFNSGSGQLKKTYLPHSRIVTANLPTTNELVAAGSPSTFTLDTIKAINSYYTGWGEVFSGLGPTGIILVPSKDAAGLQDQFSPTGTFHNKVADSVLSNYLSFDYFRNWTIVPTATIPASEKKCYPVPTMPIGRVHLKPSFDKEIVETFPKKNLEERSQSKVIAFDAPEPWRVRVCRVQYKA